MSKKMPAPPIPKVGICIFISHTNFQAIEEAANWAKLNNQVAVVYNHFEGFWYKVGQKCLYNKSTNELIPCRPDTDIGNLVPKAFDCDDKPVKTWLYEVWPCGSYYDLRQNAGNGPRFEKAAE